MTSSVVFSQTSQILGVYKAAWEQQDPDLILTIFHPEATYNERPFQSPFRGHAAIRAYWDQKVVREQSDISVAIKNVFLDGATVIAEWEASFEDLSDQTRKVLAEIAVMELVDGRIISFREYWCRRPTPEG